MHSSNHLNYAGTCAEMVVPGILELETIYMLSIQEPSLQYWNNDFHNIHLSSGLTLYYAFLQTRVGDEYYTGSPRYILFENSIDMVGWN